jgi:hypothetical protein
MGNVREKLHAMATQTMAIIEAGGYRPASGRDVLDRRPGAPVHAAFARVFSPAEEQ